MVIWRCHFLVVPDGGLGGEEAGSDVGGFAIVECNDYCTLRIGRFLGMVEVRLFC